MDKAELWAYDVRDDVHVYHLGDGERSSSGMEEAKGVLACLDPGGGKKCYFVTSREGLRRAQGGGWWFSLQHTL